MLWWLIGAWLASGAVLPVCVAYRWLTSSAMRTAPPGHRPTGTRRTPIRRKRLYMLSGLVTVGALILLFVCSLSNSISIIRDMPPASVAARVPMTHTEVAEVGPIRLRASNALSPSPPQFSAKPAEADSEAGEASRGLLAQPLGEADATIQPGTGAFGQSAGNDASHQTYAAVPQVLLTAPLRAKPGMKRGVEHRYASGPSVGPYITHSWSSGLWLFAPNGNEGANN
jgi:hypothetical protein